MTAVTLHLDETSLRTIEASLLKARAEIVKLLAEVDGDIASVRAALPRRETLVFSETDRNKSYLVGFKDGLYDCTCPAFRFGTGVRNAEGHCKHIVKVVFEGRFR